MLEGVTPSFSIYALIGGAVLGIALSVAVLVYVEKEKGKSYEQGYAARDALVLKDNAAAVLNNVLIREKQNEIRNNRPDDAGVVKRLRAGTF